MGRPQRRQPGRLLTTLVLAGVWATAVVGLMPRSLWGDPHPLWPAALPPRTPAHTRSQEPRCRPAQSAAAAVTA
jgi:hypothetical protein